MLNKTQTYTLKSNNDNAPTWFHDEAAAGRIRMFYEDDEFQYATVFTPIKTITAKIGDVIMKTRNGVTVLTKEQARKYKVSGR